MCHYLMKTCRLVQGFWAVICMILTCTSVLRCTTGGYRDTDNDAMRSVESGRLPVILKRRCVLVILRCCLFILLRAHEILFFFFFQAEDGIRDLTVTGVQTCALPI